ncbi:MAG: protein BatD [Sphingobacteriales bacterium]|nr:protein BatD [Sphingobacteriales bacterium]
MRKTAIIFFVLLFCKATQAQVSFKTIVPQHPVVVGESFQVQYAISGAEKISSFQVPFFEDFRFVSGPDLYIGKIQGNKGSQAVKNYVITLEAIKPGHFLIHNAAAIINGKLAGSNEAVITVISKEEAAGRAERTDRSVYMLRPGEDPYEKIRQNLFLKVIVDRKNCFVGEPVLAVFKLYSRLQSKSDIIKNPGFYGFTVYDMVNLADKERARETINGKIFDVHTIRKVQLFPLQPGMFSIDAMEVKNRVEFSRSVVNRKTEQEIVEGVLHNTNDEPTNENAEVFETSIATEPVVINVKPVPAVKKSISYNGAVGIFKISTLLGKSIIARNEEGSFDVIIKGQGNFTQLNAPAINWPDGIEIFPPQIKDSLDKSRFPLAGNRTFHYNFICTRPGKYQLPSVNFSFYNPVSKSYDSVSSQEIELEVSTTEKPKAGISEKKVPITEKNARASKIAAIIILSLVVLILIYWIGYKKEPVAVSGKTKTVLPSADEILVSAAALTEVTGKEFYSILHQCIWNFFGQYFNLSGSEINKQMLKVKMNESGLLQATITRLILLLEECESGIFTDAIENNKKELLEQAERLLAEINLYLFQQA